MTLQEYNDIFKNPVMKQMRITSSSNITITNTNIVSESMSIESSLCSEENLRYGRCESSCFKIRIADMNHNFKGEWLDVWMDVVTNGDGFLLLQNGSLLLTQDGQPLKLSDEEIMELSVEIGRFKVYSDKPVNDRRWRDLTCYDALYDVINEDMTSWYNGLTFPMTLKNLRDSFFTNLGITQVTKTLVNDTFITEGNFIVEGVLSGQTVIESICELNGVFGHMTGDGKFDYVSLKNAETLTLDYYVDGTGSYEGYVVEAIDGVKAISSTTDVGTSVGINNNVYIVENNPLVYGKEGSSELVSALTNLLNQINSDTFRPFAVTTYGNPMLPLGTKVTVQTRDQTVVAYVIDKSMNGIQQLKDTIGASSEKRQEVKTTSAKNELIRTKGKIHELNVTVDELSSEITSVSRLSVPILPITQWIYNLYDDGRVQYQIIDEPELDFLDLSSGYFRFAFKGIALTDYYNAKKKEIYIKKGSTEIQALLWNPDNTVVTTEIIADELITVEYDTRGSITQGRFFVLPDSYASYLDAKTNSRIQQTADNILLQVSQSYVTQSSYNAEIQNLQDQIDGYVEYWYGDWVPTLNNYPASDWDTETKKNLHLGDLFTYEHTVYHQGTAEEVTDYYRFEKDTRVTPNTYGWNLLGASDVDEALRQANEANRKAEAAQQQLNTLQSNVENNYSTTQQMNSAINLSAQSIESTVSFAQSKYDTSGLQYSISYYGYGAPSSTQYPPAQNNGNYYLNNTNGQVYYCNGTSWQTSGSPLQKITDKQQTQINQNAGQIVLKANNQGQIVQVALSASASTGSEFKVHADNIELTSGNKLVLSSNVFEINTEYFTYTPSNGLQIIDGSINIHNSNNDRYFKVNSNGTIEVALTNLSISNTGKLSCSDIDISGGAIYIHNSGSTRYFKVNSSGTIDVKLDNLTIGTTGKLTCSDIEISGGSIDLHNSGNTRYFKANADGTIEVALANLSISDTGKLTCSDIDISGGSINLHNSGNTRYFKANANGTIDVKLDNLTIDTTGKLICSDGEFTGKVISTSGQIGGWDISDSSIYKNDSSYNSVLMPGHLVVGKVSSGNDSQIYTDWISQTSYYYDSTLGEDVDVSSKFGYLGISSLHHGPAYGLEILTTGHSGGGLHYISDFTINQYGEVNSDTPFIKTKSITHTRSVASGSYTDNISSSELAISGYKCIGVLQYASAIGFYISAMLVDSTNNTASIVWMNTTSLTIPAPLRYTFLYVQTGIVDMI